MTHRPRILYVASHGPGGTSSGARLRVHHIGEALRRIGDVSLLLATQDAPDAGDLERARSMFREVTVLPMHQSPVATSRDRLAHEFDPGFLNTHEIEAGPTGRAALADALPGHDLVWVHTLRTANAFRVQRWPRSVIDVDDLHSQLYESMAAGSRHMLRRLLDWRMARLWRAREHRLPDRFDSLVVCSEQDRRSLGCPSVAHVVRNGFVLPATEPTANPRQQWRLGFIGLLTYAPNIAGITWFMQRVWPLVKQRVPQARLRLVGAGGDKLLAATVAPDVDILGYVEDPADEMQSWSASIVPVQFGGGTRIKIAEAFARKCPVVSTPLGAFGYDVRDGEELLLAGTPGCFADACVRLLEHPDVGVAIVERAWKRFVTEWTWASAERAAEAVVEATLRRQSQRCRIDRGAISEGSLC